MQRDTRTLLRTGSSILLTGVVAALLMLTAFGGVSHQGPHTNAGWLALIVVMGCLPTGGLMLTLGIAKFVGERSR
jgi:hypothetical protein